MRQRVLRWCWHCDGWHRTPPLPARSTSRVSSLTTLMIVERRPACYHDPAPPAVSTWKPVRKYVVAR
jgi:hypothetical protein